MLEVDTSHYHSPRICVINNILYYKRLLTDNKRSLSKAGVLWSDFPVRVSIRAYRQPHAIKTFQSTHEAETAWHSSKQPILRNERHGYFNPNVY